MRRRHKETALVTALGLTVDALREAIAVLDTSFDCNAAAPINYVRTVKPTPRALTRYFLTALRLAPDPLLVPANLAHTLRIEPELSPIDIDRLASRIARLLASFARQGLV